MGNKVMITTLPLTSMTQHSLTCASSLITVNFVENLGIQDILIHPKA